MRPATRRAPSRALRSVLAAATLLCAAWSPVSAQSPPGIGALAYLAGGTWRGEGHWPDGSPLKDEVRYFWGATRRILHFVSYDLVTGKRELLYEGMIFFDPRRGNLVQWNMKPSGELDVRDIGRIDSTGFTVTGPNTRSVVERTGPDTFRWELSIPKDGGWQLILDGVYRRVGTGGSGSGG
jgi:hypothetical protein